MWGGMFSTFDCAIKGIRKKEDPYNASMCTIFRDILDMRDVQFVESL